MKAFSPRSTWVAFRLTFFAALAACGGESESTNDGRFHPDPSGVETEETPACESLRAGFVAKSLALGCTGTTRVCPDFIRIPSASKCARFDAGTVDGCVAYYEDATSCEDLRERLEACAVLVIDGSEPSGC